MKNIRRFNLTFGTAAILFVLLFSLVGASSPASALSAPAYPVTISPSGTITNNLPTFTWNVSSGATSYRLTVFNNSTNAFEYRGLYVPGTACSSTVCSYRPLIVLANYSYRFGVAAVNSAGSSGLPLRSTWRTFTVASSASLARPVTISPSGAISSINPVFSWNSVSGAVYYRLAVYNITAARYVIYGLKVPGIACSGSLCQFRTSVNLANGKSYRFSVEAVNSTANSGYGPASGWRTFNIATASAPAIPTTIGPSGVISNSQPTYSWYVSSGATSYKLRVYNITLNNYPIYDLAVLSSNCSGSICSVTPAVTLGTYAYSFAVAAYNGSLTSGYPAVSSWLGFSVSNPGFNSQFTSDASGWSPVNGSWALGSGYYQTAGWGGMEASSAQVNTYTTLTYEVRFYRSGCAACATYIFFRGSPYPVDGIADWNRGIRLAINNGGFYNIVYFDGGIRTDLISWSSQAAIRPNDWNTLKVTMNGTYVQFFINNNLIALGNISIPSLASGQVGLGLYDLTWNEGDYLWVDYATLTTSAPASSKSIDIPSTAVNLDTLGPIKDLPSDYNYNMMP